MSSSKRYASKAKLKRIVQEIQKKDAITCVGKKGNKLVVVFKGRKKNLSSGTIDTNIPLELKQEAFRELSNEIINEHGKQKLTVGIAKPASTR